MMAGSGPQTFDCYVANLPLHCTETEVRDMFGIAGEIVGVKILPAKVSADGKVAFVKFIDESDAHCCAQYMNNHEMDDGRTIKVRYRPKSQDSNGTIKINGYTGAAQSTVFKKEEDEMEEVFVSHVESPMEFWGQPCTEIFAVQLEELTENMKTLCPHQPKVIGMISTDQVYGCQFSEDNLWYRCLVEKSLAKNEVHVRYIDYGNAEVTDRFGLVTLPINLATAPAMCRRYQIDGLEMTTMDTQSEIFEKGLDELIELINEEKVSLRIIRKEEDIILVKIYQNAEGALLDIPSRLIPTGSVRVKMVGGQASSFATAVKTPVKASPNGLDTFPKASPFSTNGNDISSLKTAFNHILPESPVKNTQNNVWGNDSPSKITQNHVRPIDSPSKTTPNHVRQIDLSLKTNNAPESPVKTVFNLIGSLESPGRTTLNQDRPNVLPEKTTSSPVWPSVSPEKTTSNHVRPTNLSLKTISNHIKTPDSPVKTTFNPLGTIGSPVKPRDWFSEPQEALNKSLPDSLEKNVFNHVEPSSTTEIKPSKSVVKKLESSDSKESLASETPPKKSTPEKKRSEEVLVEETMTAELYREKIENSANIIEQLKKQLDEKTNLLEGYLNTPLEINNNIITKDINNALNGIVDVNKLFSSTRNVSNTYTSTEKIQVESKGTHITLQDDDDFEDVIMQVTCKEVGGYTKELGEIKAILDLPLRHSELFNEIGIQPPKGLLICGPHGSGKTLIARAVANDRKVFVKEIFGPNVVSGSVEDANRKLNKVFKQVITNAPSILIIDQIDVIAPKKVSGKNKMVSKLLSLLNQLKQEVVIISTAVRSDNVDPVLRRAGLFEEEVNICEPDTSTRLEMLRVLSSKLTLSKSVCLNKVAEETCGYVGSNLSTLCSLAVTHGIQTKLAAIQASNKETTISFKQITLNMADFKHALEVMNSSIQQTIVDIPSTTWDDIYGMEDVKNELQTLINNTVCYTEKPLDMGGVSSKGLLFCGPHGCGKNMFAKALSNYCKCKFISIKGHELCTINDTRGTNIEDLFGKARSNAPCIIFIDEIEHLSTNNNLLHEMLKEIDYIGENENIYIIGATSRPSVVHPALRHGGRLQHIIQIPLPDNNTRQMILEKGFTKKNTSEEINSKYLENVAKKLNGYTHNDIKKIIHTVCKIAQKEDITCSHFETALKITRSVTDAECEECSRFFGRSTSNNDDEMDEEDENEDTAVFDKKDNGITSNTSVANSNGYFILLGLFTIACFIYILGLYIYTTMRY